MDYFDVTIAGAGPAGGQCARALTARGYKVLLIDKVNDLSKNNFSSAGSIIDIVRDFDLPTSVIASYWNNFVIHSSHRNTNWQSNRPLGVVMDFYKLRSFLVGEAIDTGNCKILMGHTISSLDSSLTNISLTNGQTNKKVDVRTKVIIDATGAEHAVINSLVGKHPRYDLATGIEYILDVPEKTSQFADQNSLHFFLGHSWMPQGYSWIFPMGENQFKIGAGRYGRTQSSYLPLETYIEKIINNFLRLKKYEIKEIHGSTIKRHFWQNDTLVYKNVLAIGDAASTVNWLGGEGIRHAMQSANLVAESVDDYLKNGSDLTSYVRSIKNYLSYKWFVSSILAKILYFHTPDQGIDRLVDLLEGLSADELVQTLFNYRYKYFLKAVATKTVRW